MRLIFMGTSEFAVQILQDLHAAGHEIVQVYTTPPTQAGRGQKLQLSKVHITSNQLKLPVLCPMSLKTTEIIEQIKNANADAIVVASYGKILPKPLLTLCRHGCINVHPSALPRWRGAAPIERTILAGDTTTAVCIMQMDAGVDTGDILLSESIAVPENATSYTLRDNLAHLGSVLLLRTLGDINEIRPQPQTNEGATYASKLTREESLINWSQVSAVHIERMTRALNPWPGCFFTFKGEKIRVLSAEVVLFTKFLTSIDDSKQYNPGLVLDHKLTICCGVGSDFIRPLTLQRSGKKPLPAKDFLNGFCIQAGVQL